MWPLVLAQEQTSEGNDFIDQLARTPLSKIIIFVGICTFIRLALYPVFKRLPIHRRGSGYAALYYLNEFLDAIIYAGVFVFLIIRPFAVQAFKIPSASMEDTLQINDYIVANKAIYRYSNPKEGDIVVFRPPKIACMPKQLDPVDGSVNVDFIKRCIGCPGDVIEIRSGTLYRNGKAVPEPYIKDKPDQDFKLVKYKGQDWPLSISGDQVNSTSTFTASPFLAQSYEEMQTLLKLPPEPVPDGFYLMMGDNRNNSFDGRAWGLEPRDDIIGRSELIWMPIGRWRRTH